MSYVCKLKVLLAKYDSYLYRPYNRIKSYLRILLKEDMCTSKLLKSMEDVLDFMILDLLVLLSRIILNNFGEIILFYKKICFK